MFAVIPDSPSRTSTAAGSGQRHGNRRVVLGQFEASSNDRVSRRQMRRPGLDLTAHIDQDGAARGINPFALDNNWFDPANGPPPIERWMPAAGETRR